WLRCGQSGTVTRVSNAGNRLDSWAVSSNGSVRGLPALIGVVLIFAAIIVFLVALIKTALGRSRT
ncbi:MAG TPA: hypothetical protein VF772_22740, partial [Terriglobales bacterium]